MIVLALIFVFLLIGRILFDIKYVAIYHTMGAKVKVIATGIPMVLISGYAFLLLNWKWYLIALLLFILWAIWSILFDGVIGLCRHNSFTYMSDKWPDKQLKKIFGNGVIYLIFKGLILIISIVFLIKLT